MSRHSMPVFLGMIKLGSSQMNLLLLETIESCSQEDEHLAAGNQEGCWHILNATWIPTPHFSLKLVFVFDGGDGSRTTTLNNPRVYHDRGGTQRSTLTKSGRAREEN